MCRMLGYVGPPLPLADLLTRPRHSLLVQSYKPQEMSSGTVNADGFGAALWLDDGRPDPALYRTAAPIWADPNLGWMGERLRARAMLAAVRSATPGIGYELSNVQPFVRGRLAFVHNGYIERFRQGPQRALREGLGAAAYEAIAGTSDSEHLFALVLDALDRELGPPPRDLEQAGPIPADALVRALRRGLQKLRSICEAQEVTAVASILITDGATLVAARASHGGPVPATLYAAAFQPTEQAEGASAERRPDLAFCVASEPLDPQAGPDAAAAARWAPIPPQGILILQPGRAARAESLA